MWGFYMGINVVLYSELYRGSHIILNCDFGGVYMGDYLFSNYSPYMGKSTWELFPSGRKL